MQLWKTQQGNIQIFEYGLTLIAALQFLAAACRYFVYFYKALPIVSTAAVSMD